MRLKRVISGGQTGADQQGLIEARRLGLETGGWIPRGWRTEDGASPWLATFGCQEHWSSAYKPRTEANVRDSDVTIWFGTMVSPGHSCTRNACRKYSRRCIENPHPSHMLHIANEYECVNIAGNRASKNPDVIALVTLAFNALQCG